MKLLSFLAVAVLCLSFAGSFASAQDDCMMCQFFIQYVDGYVEQNYTQQQIIKQLEVVCALAPDTYRRDCDAFVEKYVPVIINYTIKYVVKDPKAACTEIGLCTSFAAALPTNLEKFPTIVNNVDPAPAGTLPFLSRQPIRSTIFCIFIL